MKQRTSVPFAPLLGAFLFAAFLLPRASGQFIPEKPVVIHAATISVAEQKGAIKGPGIGLGSTPPSPPAGRGATGSRPAGRSSRVPPAPPPPVLAPEIHGAAAAIEQTTQGKRPPIPLVDGFDALGEGFSGREFPGANTGDSSGAGRGGIDISLAVGPDHVFEILNGNMAVFSKKGKKYSETGKLLYGAVPNNTVFAGFGVRCGVSNNSDSVVRYDQLADRWLIVVPVFTRPPDNPEGPYAMCYAVSATSDPLGPYYRYEFQRPLFPDYPRPAIWPDGYYNPDQHERQSAAGCDHAEARLHRGPQQDAARAAGNRAVRGDRRRCVHAERRRGRQACFRRAGAPNIMMSTGGTQLHEDLRGRRHLFLQGPCRLERPVEDRPCRRRRKIAVAPYHYLCDGQLSNCVSQPGTERRLDSQGDKLMQRLVYRNFGDHESILAEHSVATAAQAAECAGTSSASTSSAIRCCIQQATYAPDRMYRWLGSMAMDRKGNIGIGYSFGGGPNYPGQRFAARLAKDPQGAAHVSRIRAGGGRGVADDQPALGRLHQHRRGPVRRLYVLVHRQLSEERRGVVDHAHRIVYSTRVPVKFETGCFDGG